MVNEAEAAAVNSFAADNLKTRAEDIRNAWHGMFSNHRVRRWRQELQKQSEQTGTDFRQVCAYVGAEISEYPSFYRKLPKSRKTYIAIGMAYGLSAEDINRWITYYGTKRSLYIKDILEDMIWLYLINAGCRDRNSGRNYYMEFETVRARIEELYNEIWEQDISESIVTADLKDDFRYIEYDDEYFALKRFVSENMDSFKTAYARPRRMLNMYVTSILETKNKNAPAGRKWTLNMLRGWLDDSMINYLSGYSESINSYDRAKGCRTSAIKHVPKNKKAHISLCLALGMTGHEIDCYLQMMGYAPLDRTDRQEGLLITILENWDDMHPLQRRYKEKHIAGNTGISLSAKEETGAVNEMLQLRSDVKEIYEENSVSREGKKEKFPYMNE